MFRLGKYVVYYIKPGRQYHLPQRVKKAACRLLRLKAMRRFAKCCTALSEIDPQNTAFGCKQLSGPYTWAPPHTPPKGTFCKKSPLESRKTAFDFYCLVFHRLLSRYQKAGVHAAYSPSAASSYQLYSWGAAPNPAKGDFL